MRVCILDFETTGIDRVKDRPWELAAILCEEDFTPVFRLTSKMWEDSYPDISAEAMRVCRQESARLDKVPTPGYVLRTLLAGYLEKADHVMAFNMGFDRAFLEAECARQGITLPPISWLCAMNNVEYAEHYRCKQLSHLALDHGVSVDPSVTHGAMADCELVLALLKKGNYTLSDMLAYRDDPDVVLAAVMPKFDKAMNEAAKLAGYAWESPRGKPDLKFAKRWVKTTKQKNLEKEKNKQLAFKVEVL